MDVFHMRTSQIAFLSLLVKKVPLKMNIQNSILFVSSKQTKIFSKTPRITIAMNEAPFESLSSGESFDRWTVSIESSLHALAAFR